MARASSKTEGLTPKPSGLLPEAILVALIPALAYAIAVMYELGYASYFGIPISLVDVDFSSFGLSILSLFGIAFILFLAANLLFILWPEGRREDIQYFYPLLFWGLYVLGIFLARKEFLPVLNYSWFIIFLVLLYYILPIFQYRKEKGYIDKIKASSNAEAAVFGRSLVDKMHRKFGYFRVVSLLTILFFVPALSFNAGLSAAKGRSSFLVFHEESEYVVLKIYGEIMVCAQFKRTEREIVQRFVLRKIGETPRSWLSLERIGPLKVTPGRSTPEANGIFWTVAESSHSFG